MEYSLKGGLGLRNSDSLDERQQRELSTHAFPSRPNDTNFCRRPEAVLGAHSLYDRYESGRRILNVAQTVAHPDYDPGSHENDLALLRLANVVQFTDTVSPVRLPYLNISEFNFAGQAATISGWGIAAEGLAPHSASNGLHFDPRLAT
ncbi:Vitamin K-dependent protein C [Eumeta japonica]|uniref:Vitamin K-dependent protein C n=1 Tax=Eumeta variegata TaxID=151549 RepID=A0A4C1U7I2_EUMVA|nr:Vitamin K-dependent protein C [Eumeta japonica]